MEYPNVPISGQDISKFRSDGEASGYFMGQCVNRGCVSLPQVIACERTINTLAIICNPPPLLRPYISIMEKAAAIAFMEGVEKGYKRTEAEWNRSLPKDDRYVRGYRDGAKEMSNAFFRDDPDELLDIDNRVDIAEKMVYHGNVADHYEEGWLAGVALACYRSECLENII